MDGLSRRQLLATAGAGVSASLAGCNVPTNGGDGGPSVEDCTETLSGTVTGERTLNCKSYDVTDDVVVASGATLTVNPGVTLSFAADTGLTVEPGGSLIAKGKQNAKITFTGEGSSPGAWRGIAYDAPDGGVGDLKLDYATVEFAGGGSAGADDPASIHVRSTSESGMVSITNAVVQDGAGWGVRFAPGARVDAFESNRVTGNGTGPVVTGATTVTDLAGSNDLGGNGTDALAVDGGTLSGQHTWRDLGVPIRVRETTTVEGPLTVASSTTVEFATDQTLHVTGSGSLTASGSGSSPVVFTGVEKRPGHWPGLWFENTGAKANHLDNTVVEYGGGISPDFLPHPGNVVAGTSTDDASARVAITNSVLQDSSSNGFAVGPHATFRSFSGNEVTGCGTAVGRVNPAAAGTLDSKSKYAGNANDRVVVAGGQLPKGVGTTWSGLDVPYFVADALTVRGTLTAAAGSVVRFAPGTSLDVEGPGTVKAAGKGDGKVTLTAADESPGGWLGVRVVDGGTATFDHAVLEYGGGEAPGFAAEAAILAAGRTGADAGDPTVAIRNSVVRKGGSNGIHLGRGTTLSKMGGCRVVENAAAPVSIHASLLRALDPDTTYRDNGESAVVVRGGEGALVEKGDSFTLRKMGAAYRFVGDVIVRGHLDVESDTVVEFGKNAGLRVLQPGTLTAKGEEAKRVIFRGAEATAGYWRGIQVHSTTATFERAEILHGGGGDPFPHADYSACIAVTAEDFYSKPTLNLTTVRISDSDAYAVFIDEFATVNPKDVTIGLARASTNAESLDHDPHVAGRRGHDENR